MNRSYTAYSESRCPYSIFWYLHYFRNLFYRDSVRQSLTAYKLSKNNMYVISHFANMSNKNYLISPCLKAGALRDKAVKTGTCEF